MMVPIIPMIELLQLVVIQSAGMDVILILDQDSRRKKYPITD